MSSRLCRLGGLLLNAAMICTSVMLLPNNVTRLAARYTHALPAPPQLRYNPVVFDRRINAMKLNVHMLNGCQVAAMGFPDWEAKLTGADIERQLRLADELGFWKVTVPEHFGIPAAHIELSGDHYANPTASLGFCAGVTRNLKLASWITILPLQHPLVQAKLWATLDWLSGGRTEIVAAVGWLEEEYEMLGLPFSERGAMFDEYIPAMIELWTKDLASFEGRYVKFRDVGARPKPIQKPIIPLWFGGDAKPVLRRVARWGAGWSPFMTPPDRFPEQLDWIKSQRDYHGGPIDVVYSTFQLRFGKEEGTTHAIREAPESAPLLDAQQLIDQLGYLAGLGVTETDVARPAHRDLEEYLDWLRWLAADIMPYVS